MCTWEEIKKANDQIKQTDIKGKEYAEVNQRVKAFRMVHPNGCITTDIISLVDGVVTMKASAFDENGKLLGSGFAQEKEGSTFINKTSFIENCETSAIGRALGVCGYGIDTSLASLEEVENAMNNQKKEAPKAAKQSTNKPVKAQVEVVVDHIVEVHWQNLKKKFGVVAMNNYLKSKGYTKASDITISEYEGMMAQGNEAINNNQHQ